MRNLSLNIKLQSIRFFTIVLGSLVLISGCSSPVFSTSRKPNHSASFAITKTCFLGPVWNRGHAKASIISQDGGYSFPVPGGTLWWFGDTFKGTRDRTGRPNFKGGAVSCSVAFLPGSQKQTPPVLQYLTDKNDTVVSPLHFLPGESWEHNRIWPLAGIYLNGKSYIYYTLIEITGNGMWNFKGTGSGLACSTEPIGHYQRLLKHGQWEYPAAPAQIINAGQWLYLFEVAKKHDQQGIWLYRVLPNEIENPNAYQYYCGHDSKFSDEKDGQVLFLPEVYGQVSIAWNEYLQKYVMAGSSDFWHPREIFFRTAEKPYGPWSAHTAKIMVPEYLQGKKVELVYCSFLHPELFRCNGRIMTLTFSVQLKDSGFDANNEVLEFEIKKLSGAKESQN